MEELKMTLLIAVFAGAVVLSIAALAKRVREDRARTASLGELRALVHQVREKFHLADAERIASDCAQLHIHYDEIGTHSGEVHSFLRNARVRAAQDVVERMREGKVVYPYLQGGLTEIEMHLRAAHRLDVQAALGMPWSDLRRLHREDTLRRLQKLYFHYVAKREALYINGDTFGPKDVMALIEQILIGTDIVLTEIHQAIDETAWANRELPPCVPAEKIPSSLASY